MGDVCVYVTQNETVEIMAHRKMKWEKNVNQTNQIKANMPAACRQFADGCCVRRCRLMRSILLLLFIVIFYLGHCMDTGEATRGGRLWINGRINFNWHHTFASTIERRFFLYPVGLLLLRALVESCERWRPSLYGPNHSVWHLTFSFSLSHGQRVIQIFAGCIRWGHKSDG